MVMDIPGNILERRTGGYAALADWGVRLLLLLFLLVCIFDPADAILRAKVPIFVALWSATLLSLALRRNVPSLPAWLLIYVLVFVAIPLLSIGWYYVIDGRQPYNGFALLKGYLLVSFAVIIVLNKVDLVPQLSAVLTGLAALVIATFIYLQFAPEQFKPLHDLGVSTGMLSLDRRKYGRDLQLLQVYYVTSAMLVVSIAYYFDRVMSASGKTKLAYLILLGINIVGMLLAGTRNNIFASILLPCALWLLYAKRVVLSALCSLLVLGLAALSFASQLRAFFDTGEKANSVKLALLHDYMDLFGNTTTLLFGQGLGAYHYWKATGVSFYITELTYLELIRSFGIFGAAAMMALLLFPVWHAFATPSSRRVRALTMAYLFYLLMCISNPLLFSSAGILILATLLASIELNRVRVDKIRSPL